MRPTEICAALVIAAVTAGIVLTVTAAPAASPSLAVGPQYETTHVYVAPEELDRFSNALVATFGGTKSPTAMISITPAPSETMWQAVFTQPGPSPCSDSRLQSPTRLVSSEQATWSPTLMRPSIPPRSITPIS